MKGWLAGCRQKGRLMDGGMEGWRQVDGSSFSKHTDCSRVYGGDISSMSCLTDT